jgi:hypothetical protein
VPIIRRNNCICDTWYLSLCVDDCLVCMVEWNSNLHIRQSSTQSDKYQVSHRYSYFSWWWAHSRPKHVEKRNKNTKKNYALIWIYLQGLRTYVFCHLSRLIEPIRTDIIILGFKLVGAFAKLRKATVSFVTSVRLSAWNNLAVTGRILMKFYISVFFENPWRKLKFL